MLPELSFHIRAVTRLIYFVTEEEDRFLLQLRDTLKDKAASAKVYNAAFGLVPLTQVIQDWTSKAHAEDKGTMGIQDALIAIYKEATPKEPKFYVITDPERWMQDLQAQRRILNILHQAHNDVKTMKVLIFVGNIRYVPDKLSRYMEVIYDTGLSPDEILKAVTDTCGPLKIDPPENPEAVFQGLTSFEVRSSIIQTFKKTRGFADPKLLSEYRFKQLKKTDLLQHIDASKYTFDHVGGASRFKEWARKTRAAWTREGQDFGLKPPKGVLAVGVWGTGKSLSIKCLGNAWGLPILRLDFGRLRSARQGDSEAHLYRVTRIIESVAPCIVWIDEAEKSLSGSHSSSQTDGGTTDRMIGYFSTWVQETEAQVCVAMTANSLRTLPVEFVSRGDERWFFDLPSVEDRIDILRIHLQKFKQDPRNFNLAELGQASEAMVGREIEQCVGASMLLSYDAGRSHLDETIFLDELVRKPRIVHTMADEIKSTLDWVGFDPIRNDGVRARFAADPKGPDRKFSVA